MSFDASTSESDDAARWRELRDILDRLWASARPHAPGLGATVLPLPLPEGPVLAGEDTDGLPHLLLPVAAGHPRGVMLRTQGIGLEVRSLVMSGQPQMFVDLACRRAGLARVFLNLSVDVCMALAADARQPVTVVRRVLEDWKALLGGASESWTRARCGGLFAELTVLTRLLAIRSDAVDLWTGPSGAAQDFRSPGRAIEVKASLGPERRLVTLHGWDQLEEPADGVLHLNWFRLEEHTQGRTVRETLSKVTELSDGDPRLAKIISGLALPEPEDSEVDGRRFGVREELLFIVDGHFPRIVPTEFVGGVVPAGILDLQYTVDLDTVPASNRVSDADPVLAALAGKDG